MVYVCRAEVNQCEDEEEKEDAKNQVAAVRLNEGETRGWWRDHPVVANEAVQVFVEGAINDEALPLMLDTGANISIVHSSLVKALGVRVRMFGEDTKFYGVSDTALAAYGKATLKIRVGPSVIYEAEVWVGDFEAHSLIILGTDFMTRAGVRVDLLNKECALPEEEPVVMLTRENLREAKYLEVYDRAAKSKDEILLKDLCNVAAVRLPGDPFPEIFTLDGIDATNVNQSALGAEVFMKEGVEMSVEDMQNQLAVIPEFTGEAPEPVDLSTADVGEEENTPEEIAELREVLKEGDFCSSGNALPPPAKGVVCDIEIIGGEIVTEKARRIPIHLLGRLYELLRGLLRAGLIRHSSSRWASPIVVVLKKNGKDIRLCVDYRSVNRLTKLMVYSMPLIEDLLDSFHGVMWMCSLDNASGFWEIPLTRRARLITAFICPLGHFEWTRMPQGFKNSPQIYQRIIDNCLWGTVRRISSRGGRAIIVGLDKEELKALETEHQQDAITVSTDVAPADDVFNVGEAVLSDTRPVLFRRSYIDDINFGAVTWSEMCEMLRCLFASFREWGISISLPKSAFGKKSVEFLSHLVTREGIKSAPRNLEAVKAMQFPRSVKEVQKFLGSINYYHRFINNFATYAGALYELTDARLKDGTQLDHAKTAFEALKKALCEAPLLRHVDRTRPLSLVLYTNNWAFGAAVCQEFEEEMHPVRFYSKVFQDNERGYTPAEKEVLALLKTLEAAADVFAGQEITVYARYSTMKWLFDSKSLTGRAVQWAVLLSPWTLRIIRSDVTPLQLVAILAASVVPPEKLDEVLDSIAPMKLVKQNTLIAPMPSLRRDMQGIIVTFDGAVRTKEPKMGSYGAIVWKTPEWRVLAAAYDVAPGLTVNDSEYCALIMGLELALQHTKERIIICGDSRIVIGQVNGDLRCHQPNLVLWLNKARDLVQQFEKVHLLHVARQYNQSADYLTRVAMKEEHAGVTESDDGRSALEQLNTLPTLLYSTVDEDPEPAKLEPVVAMLQYGREPTAEVNVVTRSRRKKKTIDPPTSFDTEVVQGGDEEEVLPIQAAFEELAAAQKERFRRIGAVQKKDVWCRPLIQILCGDDEGDSEVDNGDRIQELSGSGLKEAEVRNRQEEDYGDRISKKQRRRLEHRIIRSFVFMFLVS